MVELGLLRAQAAGYALPFDVDDVHEVAWRELERADADAGRHRAHAVGRRAPRRRAARSSPTGSTSRSRPSGGLAGPARDGARLDRHRPRAPRRGAAAARPARGCSRESLDQLLVRNRAAEPPVPPLRRRRLAPALPELRHPDLLGARADRRGAPRARRPGAAGRARRGRPADRAPAARRRLAVALRRRARDRGRALRGLLGPPGRDGADGPARAVGGHGRPALPRRRRARAALDPRRTTSCAPTWSTARTSSCCARSAAAAGPTASGSPPRPARRSPACRRPGRPPG